MIGGGSVYWGRKTEQKDLKGIVVLFAWSSIHDKHLKDYIDLYSSLGWNSLVSHADFLNAFYPDQATSLAYVLLDELVEELKIRPRPLVFIAFSGGSKACMYKVFQILQGTCEGPLNKDEGQLVRICISGCVYDSGPLDFSSEVNAQFALPPTIRRMPGTSKLASWIAKGITSGLDGLYLTRFESQRAEYWHTLHSSVDLEAPILIFCSENDELAPYRAICNFVQRVQDLGGDVKIVKWNGSPHIGHYKHHPIQYKAAVTDFLQKASSIYIHRIRELGERAGMHDEISELICDLQKAADNSNQSLRRVALGPNDHFFLPSSSEYHTTGESSSASLQDEQKERPICLPQPSTINAHSVLGKILFDVCVPKNVEGWDVRFSNSQNKQSFASARRRSPFHVRSCIRRSRL